MPFDWLKAIRGDSSDGVRFWGRTYVGRGDVAAAVEAVAHSCSSAGLIDQKRREIEDGVVEIEAVQTAPWQRVWKENLLQRVTWRVTRRDGVLSISSDFRMFPRFAWRTVLLALVVGLAFATTLLLDAQAVGDVKIWVLILDVLILLPACFTVVRGVARIDTIGNKKADRVWRAVVAEIEGSGGVLEPASLGSSKRYRLSVTAYALYFFILGVGWVLWKVRLDSSTLRLQSADIVVMSFFVLIPLVALLSYFPINLIRGYGERTASINVGLSSSISACFLLLNQAPWWHATTRELPLSAVHYTEIRILCCFAILLTGFMAYGTLRSLLQGLSSTEPNLESLHWFRGHRSWAIWKSAIGDSQVTRIFRWIHLSMWCLLGLLIAGGLVLTVCALTTALVSCESPGADSVVGATAWVVASASGLSPESPWLIRIARVAWCLYGSLVLTLFLLSTGQLLYVRRRTCRRLRAALPNPTSELDQKLLDIPKELLRATGWPPVRLALREDSFIGAWSSAFGLLGRERYVEVTTGAVEHLDRAELPALVAHEVVHHLHHQPRIDNLYRWLGRLTFTGDGFSRAVQDSFRYEQEADRKALHLLDECGIGAHALRSALLKMKHTNPFFVESGGKERDTGIPAVGAGSHPAREPADAPSDPSDRNETWRIKWGRRLKLFLEQYVSGFELHYWHPTSEERLAALGPSTRASRAPGAPTTTDWDL